MKHSAPSPWIRVGTGSQDLSTWHAYVDEGEEIKQLYIYIYMFMYYRLK